MIFLFLLTSTAIALIDIVGIVSVMPFVAVVANPEIIHTNVHLNLIYNGLEFSSTKDFLLFLGLFSFTVLVASNGLTALDSWYSLRFWYMREYELSVRLLQGYLGQPYAFFFNRNTSELSKMVLSEVDRAVTNVLGEGIDLVENIVTASFIMILLIYINPWVAGVTLAVVSSAYTIIFLFINKRIKRLGYEYTISETEMYKRTQEALDGVKEIKILGKQSFFSARYARPKYKSTNNAIKYDLFNALPEQVLETMAFGGIILVAVYLTSQPGDTSYALSLVALYTFAAYRIFPALKGIFDSVENIQYNSTAMKQILEDLSEVTLMASTGENTTAEIIGLEKKIDIQRVFYDYPGSGKQAVIDLNFSIQANSATCIVGPSGAGKTTTIDIILGLLVPDSGKITVDGVDISEKNIPDWQRSLGYVPQTIYLTDDTIAENIAFGVAREEIDYEKVHKVARIARLHAFVVEELGEKSYDTRVGERGIKLSAGQRQRIGIARALYHDPNVIVLDEATNALDKNTENEVLEAILKLKNKKTIIFVSHNSLVAEKCDTVVMINKGRAKVAKHA